MGSWSAPRTLLDCLMKSAAVSPDRVVYRLLPDGVHESEALSCGRLLDRVAAIADGLEESVPRGHTVLLLARNPLRFIEAFLGCLWAGRIPVPAAVPRQNQTNGFLHAIAQNARVSAVLTGTQDFADLQDRLAGGPDIATVWLRVEELTSSPSMGSRPEPQPIDIAFLQYTSGSTSSPKGVVVSHENLLGNLRAQQLLLHTSADSTHLCWLPLYHDMGLIGHALPPIYLNGQCVLMPPAAFLQRPARWLDAVSRYRATNSGGPNFAYELCVQNLTATPEGQRDLSCWDIAYNGGEPVRADTIERFCDAFAKDGFKASAMFPCYGLAESTLVVTGNRWRSPADVIQVSKVGLEQGNAVASSAVSERTVPLVSSGRAAGDARVAVVDPHSREPLPDGRVGEIWTSSNSVCGGYFRGQTDASTRFGARLARTDAPEFLRTGDLGFLKDGNLYVTGRLKDVLVIRGMNHYPQDLELTAANSNSYLARGMAAAFLVEAGTGSAALYLMCELTREGWSRADPDVVSADVQAAVNTEHGVTVDRVLLIRPGTLPRTTSGKIRRSRCREMLHESLFETLESRTTRTRRSGNAALFGTTAEER